jgi:CRISPR system Cascade subunit CasA
VNILLSDWLPVYLRDGRRTKIAPYEVTKNLRSNPAISLAFNRPDLDATVVEMLIGMLQTFYCPDERVKGMDWNYIYNNPPDSDKLRAAFEPFAPYFNLLGDGIRFMQERSTSDNAEAVDAGALLIDFDAGQSHFAKRHVKSLCLSCMTAVLYTLQVRANSGGRGHRQNLRTANAFTTLVKGETLWETCWLNVMGKSTLEKYGNGQKNMPDDIFPWALTSTEGIELKSDDVSLLHCYWQMPRRVFLKSTNKGNCMLCHGEDICVTKVVSSPRGVHYYGIDSKGRKQTGENWFHPLSPLTIKEEKPFYELFHHNEYGARYKHWLALTRTKPAPCVIAAKQRNKAEKLWAFGYVCSSKMALFWDDGEFSIISLPTGDKLAEKDAEHVVHQLMDIATKAAEHLQKYAGRAIGLISKGEKGRKVNWPKIDKEPISTRFWQASEQDFYSHVKGLQDIVSGLRSSDEVLLSWSNRVRNHAINIFDSIIDFDAFSSETMSIVAEHRADLMKKLNSLYRTRKEDKSGEIKVQEW